MNMLMTRHSPLSTPSLPRPTWSTGDRTSSAQGAFSLPLRAEEATVEGARLGVGRRRLVDATLRLLTRTRALGPVGQDPPVAVLACRPLSSPSAVSAVWPPRAGQDRAGCRPVHGGAVDPVQPRRGGAIAERKRGQDRACLRAPDGRGAARPAFPTGADPTGCRRLREGRALAWGFRGRMRRPRDG